MAKKKSGGKGWVMTAARQAYYASKKKGGGGKSPISGSFASNALKSGHVKIIVTKSRKKFSVAPIKRTPAQRLALRSFYLGIGFGQPTGEIMTLDRLDYS